MFLCLRILGGIVGVLTAGPALIGRMTTPEFIVADVIIGVVLVAAAIIPSRTWAWRGLLVGNAYALGVFTVALARQLGPEVGAASPLLIVGMLAAGLGLVGLWIDRRTI